MLHETTEILCVAYQKNGCGLCAYSAWALETTEDIAQKPTPVEHGDINAVFQGVGTRPIGHFVLRPSKKVSRLYAEAKSHIRLFDGSQGKGSKIFLPYHVAYE